MQNNFCDLYKYQVQKFELLKDAVNRFEVDLLNKAIMVCDDIKEAGVH